LFETIREQARLLLALFRERAVGMALHAALLVPHGFAVAYQY
jgi:hypothetical protein